MSEENNDGKEEWIQKYDLNNGFENITQKALFNKYKGKVKEFYLFPKNKAISLVNNEIIIPHPSIGINLKNGDITLNDAPMTFQDDFDEELKNLDLIYYWTNHLISHQTFTHDGKLYGKRDVTVPVMYHVGWKNSVGKRIIKLDLDSGKFSIKTKKR